jgi:hypothetical protein
MKAILQFCNETQAEVLAAPSVVLGARPSTILQLSGKQNMINLLFWT